MLFTQLEITVHLIWNYFLRVNTEIFTILLSLDPPLYNNRVYEHRVLISPVNK